MRGSDGAVAGRLTAAGDCSDARSSCAASAAAAGVAGGGSVAVLQQGASVRRTRHVKTSRTRAPHNEASISKSSA
jgi:hypothetical protein